MNKKKVFLIPVTYISTIIYVICNNHTNLPYLSHRSQDTQPVWWKSFFFPTRPLYCWLLTSCEVEHCGSWVAEITSGCRFRTLFDVQVRVQNSPGNKVQAVYLNLWGCGCCNMKHNNTDWLENKLQLKHIRYWS